MNVDYFPFNSSISNSGACHRRNWCYDTNDKTIRLISLVVKHFSCKEGSGIRFVHQPLKMNYISSDSEQADRDRIPKWPALIVCFLGALILFIVSKFIFGINI